MRKSIFITKLFIIHIFSQIRLNILILFLKNKILHKNQLAQFKKTGIIKLPNYIPPEKVSEILKECESELDNLKNISMERIEENLVLKSGLRVEKIDGSIKIKNLQLANKNLPGLVRNKALYFFASFYSYGILNIFKFISIFRNGVTLIYNLTHDGSYKHSSVPGASKGNVIAGMAHFDTPYPIIKGLIALKKIDINNGPFVCYENSNKLSFLIKHNFNYFFNITFNKSRNSKVESEMEKNAEIECKNKFNKFTACLNPGDLVLFDSRNVHHASTLEAGERQILWVYF